jgi:Holliday junction DNA helicase RuvB
MPNVTTALIALHIDENGLDRLDYNYLNFIADHYKNSAVGLDTIAAGISEDKDTIEDIIEPYLMKLGFVKRTPRGRELTNAALSYLGAPNKDAVKLL